MYASEHRARTQVEELLDEKNKLLEEKNELLSKSFVERANRYLGPPAEQQEFSPMKALPLLYAAMENDQHNGKRREASRIRLGAALRQLPSVERLWLHKGGIWAAAVSPAGDRFATGGGNGTVYVWDVSKGDPVTPALVHPGAVTSVAFAPDGKSVATGCADGGVRLWHTASGKLIRGPLWDAEFGKATSPESAALFGVDRQSLLALRGPAAQLWNTSTGAAIGKTLTVHPGSVCLADKGKLVLSIDANAIVAWDPQTGKEEHRLADKEKFSQLLAIAPDGVTVAVPKTTQSIQLWNCRTNEKLAVTQASSSPVTALKFSPDGAVLAGGTDTGTVYLWKSSDGSLVGQQQLSPNRISIFDFSGNGHQLAVAAGIHGIVTMVGLDNAEPVPPPIHIPSTIRAAQWVPGKEMLLTFSADGAVRLWETRPRRAAVKLADAAPIRGAASSKDCQTLATIDTAGSCTITQLRDDEANPASATAPISTGIDKPATVALTSSGSKFAIADSRGALSVWDVAGRKKMRDLDTGAPRKRGRKLSSDTRLAFTGDDRLLIHVMNRWKERICEISVWNVESGERLRYQRLDSDGSLNDFDLQAGGSVCAVAAGRHLTAWNAASGQQFGPVMLHDNRVTACRLSPDGTQVISGCSDGIARIWNISTGKAHAATIKHPDSIASVASSPDRLRFATGGYDGTARIWSMSTAASLAPPLAHGAPVTGCQFSPDSRWLLTTSGNASSPIRCKSILRVWDATTGEPLFGLPLDSMKRGPLEVDPSQIELSWFSSDSRLLHFVIHGGLVETLSLAPDARVAPELLREIVIRSGIEPDGAGGVSILHPDSVTRRFRREVLLP
jgi:WD40 repeat protein